LDRFAEGRALEGGEPAADIHQRDFVCLADLYGEAQDRVLLRKRDDFTLNREEGKS
jgi:hypothetical protein